MSNKNEMRKEQELRIIPQKGAYKNGKDDYAGMVGKIEVCKKCCRGKLRIQFIGCGNNEPLDNFNLDYCRFLTN